MNSRSSTIAFVVVIIALLIANVSIGWYIAAITLFLLANVYGSMNLDSQYYIKSLFHGSPQKKTVAITFDDGPIPGKTEQVLDILDKHSIKATFFCIGKMVKENPELLRKIHQHGHLIGNHSYYHGALFDLQLPSTMKDELVNTDSAVFDVLGRRPRYFRPPYGVTNPMLSRAVSQTKHVTVGWSMRSFDTVMDDKQKLIDRITKSLKAGDILLLHDKCDVTIQALPDLIEFINKSGLSVEPLDKMLGEPAYA